jgi:ribosomal protein S7
MKLKNLLLNHLIVNGNKQTSENLILKSFKTGQKQCFKNHREVFKSAVINSSPIVNLKYIMRGRKQVKEFPFVLHKHIRTSLAIKLILHTINKNSEAAFSSKFNNEIMSTSKNSSNSVKTRYEIHNNAFVSRKYANYRWF